LETTSKIEVHHLAEASLSNQHIACTQSQNLLQSHSIDQTNRIIISSQNDSNHKATKRYRIWVNTSKGNMVSPPSSTLDRYNKKEATCTMVNQSQNYNFGKYNFHKVQKDLVFF